MGEAGQKEYESVIVLDPTLSDPAAKGHVAKLEELIREHGAREVEIGNWGRRDIPHRARKFKQGSYVCLVYKSDNRNILDELNRALRIDPNVIKFQSHRIQSRMRKPKFSTRLKRLAEAENNENGFGLEN